MKLARKNQAGFGVVEGLVIVVIIVAIGLGGWAVYHHDHKKDTVKATTATTASTKTTTTKSTTTKTADPYAGWQSYCDTKTTACIKYPADWTAVANAPGAFQNSAETGYVSLSPGTSKDGAQGSAYIYSVQSLTTSATPVDIVGYVINNQPGYEIFDASYVTSAGIKAGTTEQLDYGNYAFTGKTGTVSVVATVTLPLNWTHRLF